MSSLLNFPLPSTVPDALPPFQRFFKIRRKRTPGYPTSLFSIQVLLLGLCMYLKLETLLQYFHRSSLCSLKDKDYIHGQFHFPPLFYSNELHDLEALLMRWAKFQPKTVGDSEQMDDFLTCSQSLFLSQKQIGSKLCSLKSFPASLFNTANDEMIDCHRWHKVSSC